MASRIFTSVICVVRCSSEVAFLIMGCPHNDFGYWTSTSTGKKHRYCRECRRARARTYKAHTLNNGGRHTHKEWLNKLAQFDACPRCNVRWEDIPPRPDRRYKQVWTKGHIVPNSKGGTSDIGNIQPLCYVCNFSEGNREAAESSI